MRRLHVHLAMGLCLLIQPTLALANSFEIAPTLFIFNFQEFDQNHALLDQEEGVLSGVRLSYRNETARDILRFQASLYDGSVDYEGSRLAGFSHQTDTDQQLARIGLSYQENSVSFYPGLFFAGLNYAYWDRDIQSRNAVRGQRQQYTWYEAELGLKFESQPNQQTSYWLELSAMYNFKPEMKLFLPSSDVVFFLGSAPGYRIRAGKTWDKGPGMTYSIAIFAEYWEFGRSNTIFTTDFFGSSGFLTEPESESLHAGLEFSFSF